LIDSIPSLFQMHIRHTANRAWSSNKYNCQSTNCRSVGCRSNIVYF